MSDKEHSEKLLADQQRLRNGESPESVFGKPYESLDEMFADTTPDPYGEVQQAIFDAEQMKDGYPEDEE